MKEHKNAEFLRALADGKSVQTKFVGKSENEWMPVENVGGAIVALIRPETDNWSFRIAPETVTVTLANGEVRHINAPLRKVPEVGTVAWFVNAYGYAISSSVHDDIHAITKLFKAGLFATESDAQAWANLQKEILGIKS